MKIAYLIRDGFNNLFNAFVDPSDYPEYKGFKEDNQNLRHDVLNVGRDMREASDYVEQNYKPSRFR